MMQVRIITICAFITSGNLFPKTLRASLYQTRKNGQKTAIRQLLRKSDCVPENEIGPMPDADLDLPIDCVKGIDERLRYYRDGA